MKNSRTFHAAAAALLAVVVGLAPAAVAGERYWSRYVQGPQGRGFQGSAAFTRDPGAIGFEAQRVYGSGATAQWSGSVVRADGTFSRQRAHTGAGGRSQSAWSTVSRLEDSVARSHGVSTASGRGYTAHGQAQRTDEGLVVSRAVVTASGRSADWTRTYPRFGPAD